MTARAPAVLEIPTLNFKMMIFKFKHLWQLVASGDYHSHEFSFICLSIYAYSQNACLGSGGIHYTRLSDN